MAKSTYKLLNNSRFYILATSVIVSLATLGILRLQTASDQVFYIRLEQIYGLVAVLFWYFALIISPIGYVIGKSRMKKVEFARRAIGVSAFYFAFLHALVAFLEQLGGISGVGLLPELFHWSLLGGVIALSILAVMALTSFDAVIKFMTFRKWKWLHRLVYIGGVLTLLHIWTIGTHMAYTSVRYIAFAALIVLIGLELFRTIKLINQKYLHLERAGAAVLLLACWCIFGIAIALVPSLISNYHSAHINHDSSSGTHNHGGGR